MSDTPNEPLKRQLDDPKPVARKGGGKKKPPPLPPADDDDDQETRWFRTDPPVLPHDCPVICLGRDKRRYAFIDSNRQFVEVEVNQLSSDGLADLFAEPKSFAWLWEKFPKFNKDRQQIGWDKERAKIAVMQACAHAGPFNFEQRVRGEGAWRDNEGRLHWHLGDRVLVVETNGTLVYETSPLVYGYVYPQGSKQPQPAEKRDAGGAAIKALFALMKRWHWSRDPDLDARMMLGWIGCAIIAGALGWKPAMWLQGPRGSGKTTLQLIMRYVMGGDGALIQASDASSAGIYTALRNRAIPVLVDEAEPKKGDNRHIENVIGLARAATNGSRILRSGSNHESREFTANACFGFSSIQIPALETADRTRMVMLRLQPAQKGAGDLHWEIEQLAEAGRQIRRILVDAWTTWPKLLSAWRNEFMGPHELEPRVADTWGSVLAMADLLLNAEERLADGGTDAAEISKWTAPVAIDVKEMLEQQGNDHDRVVDHLLTSTLDPWSRGQKYSCETLIAVAGSWASMGDLAGDLPAEMTALRANSGLVSNGLKVVKATRPPKPGETANDEQQYLAIHKRHRGGNKIFEDTQWKDGGHLQQLEQVPGAFHSRQRFAAGKRDPCVMVPLRYLLEDPGAAAAPPPAPPRAIADYEPLEEPE